MNKSLLVVESPTKARTIGKYLGDKYQVIATVGHLRDLPKNKMSVDPEKDFEVTYVVNPERKKLVAELISASKKADQILLATDPDREGEAISWHVKTILDDANEKSKKKLNISRVTFHEITKEAVEEALEKARQIDMALVNAQQGRRVLDRLVGYSLSPILWRKVRRGLSAGRVQSVVVRLICEREKEIEAFGKEKFFKVFADVISSERSKSRNLDKIDSSASLGMTGMFKAELTLVDEKSVVISQKIELFDGVYSYSKTIFSDADAVAKFIACLSKEFVVESVEGREISRTPLPPYTTSKLQQAAARKFGWSGKQTMSVAQKLYEKGLITYHRTDSVYLADKAVAQFRAFIAAQFGANYLSKTERHYKNTSKNAQEAHEAIRPTGVEIRDQGIEDSRERKLYELIWKRAVATQAAAARLQNTKVKLVNGRGVFESKGVRMAFDGFLKITGEQFEDQVLPELVVGDKLRAEKIQSIESETMPPPRYGDASLVASLEKQGIGRPSTYAPIISTIIARQYVEKEEGKFRPTALGVAVNLFLVKNFENIVTLPFTADMETNLDKIADGKLEWKQMMKDFWKDFKPEIKKVEKDAERVKVEVEKLDEKCPLCQEGGLVIRVGRFGKFVSCDRFPECKYTRAFKEMAGFDCPTCGKPGVVKRTKTGRKFFGCSDYPNCKWAGWKRP